MENIKFFAEPIVQWTVYLEFKGADRMSNAFDAVTLSVSKIIHRVYAPFVASAMMLCIFDAIHQRVAQLNIRTEHISSEALRAGSECDSTVNSRDSPDHKKKKQ